VRYSFTFWVLDSWDWNVNGQKDGFKIQFDNLPVIEGFGVNFSELKENLCGATNWLDTAGFRVYGWIAHTSLTLSIKFITNFDEATNNESLGVRDIALFFSNDNPGNDYLCGYTDSTVVIRNQATCACKPGQYSPDGTSSSCTGCSPECASCYGFGVDKCYNCAQGFYFDGTKCSKCDPSCSKCTGPGYNQCTACYSGFALFNGVCIDENRCLSSPFVLDDFPKECHSPCSLSSLSSWDKNCFPPCLASGVSELDAICKSKFLFEN